MKKSLIVMMCVVLMMLLASVVMARNNDGMAVFWGNTVTSVNSEPCVYWLSDNALTLCIASLVILGIATCLLTLIIRVNRYYVIEEQEKTTRDRQYNEYCVEMVKQGYEQVYYPGTEDWVWQKAITVREEGLIQ